MRVADYIADFVYRQGVEHIFMVSGGGMMFLSDALAVHPHLKVVCNHHEQASAMAAVGYGKYTGRLGVAYVTTGCGGTNTVTGVLDAWQDSIPTLFVSGQAKRKETVRNSGLRIRQVGVQEADIIAIVESITKYSVMINEPNDIAYHLEKALYLAQSGRPGPVWLDVPLDVQSAIIEPDKLRHFSSDELTAPSKKQPDAEVIKQFRALAEKAKRPIIVAGQGIRIANAIPEFKAFIEKYSIPFVTTRLGIDILPSSHPLYIGRIGHKGDRAGNFAVQNTDFLIGLGSRMSVCSTGHEYRTFAREAKIAIVDIDPVEHQKNTIRIDLFVEGDVKNFLQTVTPDLKLNSSPQWIAASQGWKKKWTCFNPEYYQSEKVNVYCLVEEIAKQMKDDAAVVTCTGSAYFITAQCMSFKEGQRYIPTGAEADMGFALPAAIGVSCARGKKEVIALSGDGSFQMNIQELQTVTHNKLPIKTFILNNEGYQSIRITQRHYFSGRYIGTDSDSGVSFPNMELIAKAYSMKYIKIANTQQLAEGVKQVLDYDGPVLCEVICVRDQAIIPCVTSMVKPNGTMVSKPLEDMFPFLDRKEFLANMLIKPLDE